MGDSRHWIRARQCADELDISESTLQQWRYRGVLKPGTHYKRKFAGNSNSPILCDIDRIYLNLKS